MYDLLILGFSVIIILIGIVLYKKRHDDLSVVIIIIGVFLTFVVVTGMTLSLVNRNGEIVRLKASIATVEQCLENDEHITNAALSVKIAEINEWIACGQYYNQYFDLFWPDEIDEMELIKIKPTP
jgi:hypothetical protein